MPTTALPTEPTVVAPAPRPADERFVRTMDEAPDGAAQQRTRIAWLYYVEGQTQKQIGERLGISRVRVNRELALCREQGIVQIRINGKLAPCIALERRLEQRFGLIEAVVVPTPSAARDLPKVIGLAVGTWLSDRLVDARSLGVGWGHTLFCSLQATERRSHRGLAVVSLMGGLTRASAVNTYETASRFADLLGAECYYLAAPTFASSAASRRTIVAQEVIQEVSERGRNVDIALASVGDLGPQSTMRQLGLLSDEDAASLAASGAVGDLLGHYLDREGRLVPHPINDRVIGLAPADLARIPLAVLASGGEVKVAVIGGVLRARYVNTLITDEQTATALLAADGG
jgi:DNA-binding transcriptional regulator LsrR (DeoR family)